MFKVGEYVQHQSLLSQREIVTPTLENNLAIPSKLKMCLVWAYNCISGYMAQGDPYKCASGDLSSMSRLEDLLIMTI